MNIIIEKAIIEDGKALTMVQKRAFNDDTKRFLNKEKGGPSGYDSLKWNLIKIRSNHYYKIRLETYEIIGGVIISPKNNSTIRLERIFITPQYQNCGIGQNVMREIETFYPDAGQWLLDTPRISQRNQYFYEKNEYIKQSESDSFVYYCRLPLY